MCTFYVMEKWEIFFTEKMCKFYEERKTGDFIGKMYKFYKKGEAGDFIDKMWTFAIGGPFKMTSKVTCAFHTFWVPWLVYASSFRNKI